MKFIHIIHIMYIFSFIHSLIIKCSFCINDLNFYIVIINYMDGCDAVSVSLVEIVRRIKFYFPKGLIITTRL